MLCVYTWIERIGTTSIKVGMEAWTKSRSTPQRTKVTTGHFIYVALTEDGQKRVIGETVGS